ncbi:hypothetical protein JYK14_02930 [Siccirubricoccus sp. KC 17139]|uniref:Phage tail tape measure protein domain-containing protein n=1 Tax=Siccirubricoccus soli TaxID=2899147 RepID=A0ABT1CZQ1_9PROT|nr:hypothetical protein [Siccirubricoccus soli]MCO6415131.1 hypothetical protein [Siccirubricoccus soli]MCP2681262.1 hypothetical protein [Siccirubricoccus soli]
MSGSASYTVFARLQITGNAHAVLRQLGRELTSLNARITAVERNAQKLVGTLGQLGTSSGMLGRVTGSLGQVRSATQGVSSATQGATRAINSQTAAMQRNLAAARQITTAAQQAAAAMQRLSAVPPPPRLPAPSRAGAGGGGSSGAAEGGRVFRRPSLFEAYYGARAALSGPMAALEAGGGEQQAETMMTARGMSAEERQRVMGAARTMVREVPGSSVTDAVGAVMEARSAIGGSNTEGALQLAPHLLRAARLSATVTDRSTAEGLRPIARSLAIRGSFTDETGRLNIEQGAREIRELENAIIAFSTSQGEGVDPNEWQNFFKQAGTAGRRMSIQSVVGPMGSLIQEVGGMRAGTMATAFNDQVVSGVMSQEREGKWREAGLLVRPGQERRAAAQDEATLQRLVSEGKLSPEEANTARERARTAPQGERAIGRGLATVRPDLWMQEVFAERARAKGRTTEDAMLDWWDELGSRATGRRFGMSMLQTREVQGDIGLVDAPRRMRAAGQDPTAIILSQGYANSLANLQSGFTNLLTALGNAPSVIGLLNDTAKSFNDLAELVRDNPSFMEGVVVELRRLLSDARVVAEGLGEVVGRVAGFIRFLRGEPIPAVPGAPGAAPGGPNQPPGPLGGSILGRAAPGGSIMRQTVPGRALELGRTGAEAAGEAAGAVRRFLNRGIRVRPMEQGPEAAPPSWGGPQPRRSPTPTASGASPAAFNPMPPRGDVVLRTQINLDGRVLGEAVTRHQARLLSGPPVAAPRPDPRRAPFIPGGATT